MGNELILRTTTLNGKEHLKNQELKKSKSIRKKCAKTRIDREGYTDDP